MACDPGVIQGINELMTSGRPDAQQQLEVFARSFPDCASYAQSASVTAQSRQDTRGTRLQGMTGEASPWQSALAGGKAGSPDPAIIAGLAAQLDQGQQGAPATGNQGGGHRGPGGVWIPDYSDPAVQGGVNTDRGQWQAALAGGRAGTPDQYPVAPPPGQNQVPNPQDQMAQFMAGTTAGRTGALGGTPPPGGDQSSVIDYMTGGGDSWLNDTGMGFSALFGINPYEQQGLMRGLDLYADTQGNKPGYWARQQADLMSVMPGLEAIASPGSAPASGLEYLNNIEDYDRMLNTPGQYLDIGGMYDDMFSGIPGQTGETGQTLGPGTAMNLQQMTPDEQISTVMGAYGALSPFIHPDAANDISVMLSQAAMDWQQMVDSGDLSYPDFLSYLYSIGAADWM